MRLKLSAAKPVELQAFSTAAVIRDLNASRTGPVESG